MADLVVDEVYVVVLAPEPTWLAVLDVMPDTDLVGGNAESVLSTVLRGR